VSPRRQLPAYSPLPLRAVLAGVGGLVAGGARPAARAAATLQRPFRGSDVLLTDSGTGALALAIRGCLQGAPGATVALPAYACYDIATAADGADAPVVLYDLDPATLAPEPASLGRALARGARAVVLVHLYGIPVDPDPVRRAAEAAGARLIEDAAQGAGASVRGSPAGSFGDVTVLSFGRGKGNTAGRGGALLAPTGAGSDLLAAARPLVLPRSRGAREAVQLAIQWLVGRPALYALPASLPFLHLGETRYHPPSPVRAISAVAARTLAVTWPLGEREARVRRANAERLLARAGPGLVPPRPPAGTEAGYLRLPFLASPAARAAVDAPAARRLGAMPGYPRALCDLAGFAGRVVNSGDPFPGARQLAERLVTVPTHSRLSRRDRERLARWVGEQ
jgi:perosamine synthetase